MIDFFTRVVYFSNKTQVKPTELTVEQLKQMLTTNNYSSVISKLMHYAKNVTGSSGYWHKSKKDLKATITQKGPPTIFLLCHVQSITAQSFTTCSTTVNQKK